MHPLCRCRSRRAVACTPTTYSYDALGNIATKSDVAGGANYLYGLSGAGPHAVSQIGSALYTYDANGAMVSGDGKTTTWTSFNKPRKIEDDLTGDKAEFVYGPSRARFKQQIIDGGLRWSRRIGQLVKVYSTG